MGKSSQVSMDHDSSSDRITARVGSRTKKAKIVFDPSDHHVPRKRNRRGENEPTTGMGTPKSESTRTATPLSSSSNEGSSYNNHSSTATASTVSGGQRSATATTTLCRVCQKCGRSGPGRMPRKSPITPWTCSGCLIPKMVTKTGSAGGKQGQSKMQSKSSRDRTSEEEAEEEAAAADEMDDEEEEEEEEDNKQQHDFAGFSETELGAHGNVSDVTVDQKLYVREPHADSADGTQNKSKKPPAAAPVKRTGSHDEEEGDESAKDVRYWSCDDVCRFFSRHSKSWGDLFHEQEIDGASLLLMRKGDVLSRFGLKLGPAMELYQRIVALQNGDRDIVDVRLTWI